MTIPAALLAAILFVGMAAFQPVWLSAYLSALMSSADGIRACCEPPPNLQCDRGAPVTGWQVIDEGERLRVVLADGASIDTAATADSVRQALARVGVIDVPVQVDLVEAIPRTALGKVPLVRRQPPATPSH